MDHLPYPTGSTLPPIQIPLLFEYESCELDTETEDFNTSTIVRGQERSDGIEVENPPASSLGGSSTYAASLALPQLPAQNVDSDKITRDEKRDWTSTFWHYPRERGWVTAVGSSSWLSCSGLEAARRAQEWLYFELLHGFLDRKINPQELSKPDPHNGQRLLDSTALPDLLAHWTSNVRSLQSDIRLYAEGKVLSLLEKVVIECKNLGSIQEAAPVSLAILVLADTLAKAVLSLRNSEDYQLYETWSTGPHAFLRERMLANHWCPFQINRFVDEYTPTAMYYLSSLPRLATFGGVDHDQCLETQCRTTSVDPRSYEPRHADDCQNNRRSCNMLGVDAKDVASIIEMGSVPLIMLDESPEGQMKLTVVKSHPGLRYVALSHVWSGGLGNVNANCMRSCQLYRVQQMLNKIRENGDDDLDRNLGIRKFEAASLFLRMLCGLKLPPEQPILLWMDTLCVPVGPEWSKAYRMAIAQMAQIYVEAQCVLVLDPELEKLNHKDLPDHQVFATVLCSSWNARSWTFQEASMARTFYVQFADGYCVIDERWHELMEPFRAAKHSKSSPQGSSLKAFSMSDFLTLEFSRWFFELPVMTKIRGHDTRVLMSKNEDWKNFACVWNALRSRSTTKVDDLYGIIAVMVDLSADEILKLDKNERMKSIIRSQSSLPLPLLYQKCSRLLDNQGRPTWAPANITGSRLGMSNGYMTVTGQGLLIGPLKSNMNHGHTWPQAYLLSNATTVHSPFTMRLPDSDNLGYIEPYLLEGATSESPSNSWICLFDNVKGGLALHNIPGVLLSVQRVENSVYHTSYLCPVTISFAGTGITGNSETNRNSRSQPSSLVGSLISWKDQSIKIESGMLTISLIQKKKKELFLLTCLALRRLDYLVPSKGSHFKKIDINMENNRE